jgi:hypothetical protein
MDSYPPTAQKMLSVVHTLDSHLHGFILGGMVCQSCLNDDLNKTTLPGIQLCCDVL